MLRVQTPAPVGPLPPPQALSFHLDDATVAKLLAQIARIRQRPGARTPRMSLGIHPEVKKATQGAHDDSEELAFRLFAEETAALHQANLNEQLLDEIAQMEAMDMYDHEVALALSEGREPPPMPDFSQMMHHMRGGVDWDLIDFSSPPPESVKLPTLPEGDYASYVEALREALQGLDVRFDGDEGEDDASCHNVPSPRDTRDRLQELRLELAQLDQLEAGSQLCVPRASTPPPVYSCTVCGDDIKGTLVRLGCGHTFDNDCVTEMFKRATIDESLYPPKCCQGAIELSAVEQYLQPALIDIYKKKAREFTTANRVYCHEPACATFLGPATPEDAPETLRCPECDAPTCASCKEQAHPGVPCHFHAEDAVLDLGKAEKWQRCPSCKHLVELSIGCYHITCRCSTQFCYVCAALWKQCDCPLFYVPPEED
ncbi:hypothetical protein ONZ51_g12675 [Trametes cubensis]|uniref:RBR-type E3 ubiquitin transferase n=1 Tax=Trametes cubensis TaxID=1111947 RepID=A0AAD7X6N9_9APHY|nr:hypothetical protein ONZ51_g12675 [Trametes cubensis]